MECQTVYLKVVLMKLLPDKESEGPWSTAVLLLERWLGRHVRLDALMEDAGWEEGAQQDRARCQHLLFGVVRNLGRIDAALGALVVRTPRTRLRALLLVAGFELLEAGIEPAGEGRAAQIVHHAVAQAKLLLSPVEARMVNAVLRRLAGAPWLREPAPADTTEWARFFSHPAWLVRRWLTAFGAEATHSLLRWNQTPPPIYGRWRAAAGAEPGAPPPAWLHPTTWPGFHVVPAGHWAEVQPLLADGRLYLQDPATVVAPELLAPAAGECILDLCAAPGGKSLVLADLLRAAAMAGAVAPGRVVAVDLPDECRIGRLRENLAKIRGTEVALVQANVRQLSAALLEAHHLPEEYPAVLLDVPCSNTGVMRHRVDAKWRLREGDIARHAALQLTLLTAAARFVAPGGRLVYSTCSLEPEENEGVVEAFLRETGPRFTPGPARHCRPWEAGCDGAGAFLLRKNA